MVENIMISNTPIGKALITWQAPFCQSTNNTRDFNNQILVFTFDWFIITHNQGIIIGHESDGTAVTAKILFPFSKNSNSYMVLIQFGNSNKWISVLDFFIFIKRAMVYNEYNLFGDNINMFHLDNLLNRIFKFYKTSLIDVIPFNEVEYQHKSINLFNVLNQYIGLTKEDNLSVQKELI